MRNKVLLGAILAGVMALSYAFMVGQPVVEAAGPKNLKVFPPDTSKSDIKKAMKGIAEALGVECDFCHDLKAMDADTEKKEVARKMMRMAADINKKSFDGKRRVTCMTCHNGKKEPK